MPERPSTQAFQEGSVPMPRGVSIPIPVTTTRLDMGDLLESSQVLPFYQNFCPSIKAYETGGSWGPTGSISPSGRKPQFQGLEHLSPRGMATAQSTEWLFFNVSFPNFNLGCQGALPCPEPFARKDAFFLVEGNETFWGDLTEGEGPLGRSGKWLGWLSSRGDSLPRPCRSVLRISGHFVGANGLVEGPVT